MPRAEDIVVTGAGTDDDLEILRRVDHLGGDLVAADDERVGIGHGGQQFGLAGIFFEQGEFVAGPLDDFADTLDRLGGEGFLGCNEYFHGKFQCGGFL